MAPTGWCGAEMEPFDHYENVATVGYWSTFHDTNGVKIPARFVTREITSNWLKGIDLRCNESIFRVYDQVRC